jgi:hypothetical protein
MISAFLALILVVIGQSKHLEAQWHVEGQAPLHVPVPSSNVAYMTLNGLVPEGAFEAALGVGCVALSRDPRIIIAIAGLARFAGSPIATRLDSEPAVMFTWTSDSGGRMASLDHGAQMVSALSRADTLSVRLPLLGL